MRSILQRACALLGLWAIAGSAGAADSNREPLERALRWLESRQDMADGAWRAADATATMLQTTAALSALQAAGRRSAAWYAGQAWLGNHGTSNTDTRARRLRALRAGVANLQYEIEALVRARSGSGWGLAQRYQRDPLDSALALAALRQVGSTLDLRESWAWLRGVLTDDAAWPIGAAGTAPGPLAQLLESLAPAAATDPALSTALQSRLRTLTPERLASSSPRVRAQAALAWQALLPGAGEGRALLSELLAAQAPAGDVAGDVLATSLLIRALVQVEAPGLANKAERVAIPDSALRAAINASLGRGALDSLTRADLAQLAALDLDGRRVHDLQGLEYALNLHSFSAGDSPIVDFSPLAQLPLLTSRRVREASSPTLEAPSALAAADAEPQEPQTVPLLPTPASWLLPLGLLLLRKAHARGRFAALLAGLVFAGHLPAATTTVAPALAPQVTDGVQAVSRQLLQAIGNVPADDAARETLQTTRTLIVELETAAGQASHVANQSAAKRSTSSWLPLPPATVARARDLISRLRTTSTPDVRSNATARQQLALAGQRAVLFQRWANELEAVLAPEAPDRLARLAALRRRLQENTVPTPRRGPASPTLQALPAPRR